MTRNSRFLRAERSRCRDLARGLSRRRQLNGSWKSQTYRFACERADVLWKQFATALGVAFPAYRRVIERYAATDYGPTLSEYGGEDRRYDTGIRVRGRIVWHYPEHELLLCEVMPGEGVLLSCSSSVMSEKDGGTASVAKGSEGADVNQLARAVRN